MNTLTEESHAGEAIISEANGLRSREVKTLLSGQNVKANEVLSAVLAATSATAAAVAGNTGDGTMGSVVLSDGYKVGVYRVTFIEPGTDTGDFIVEDPDGIQVGAGVAATEFSAGGLTFTIADGATDFASGDAFTITIAAGSGKFVAYDQDGTDGSEVAAGIAFDKCDASAADKELVVLVRDCVVDANILVWPSDIDAGEKTAAIAQLKQLGIIVR